MARKYELISELYAQTCQEVVSHPNNWQEFLRSACRNYKLRYDEQLLVYVQRPDATAVLEIEKWNSRFGRWVNRGAKGIAVFEEANSERQRLTHYFDISDTHESKYARPVPIWKMKEEYADEIIETLESTFGTLDDKSNLGQAILSASKNAIDDNIPDYIDDLIASAENSFFEGQEESVIESVYKSVVANSVSYMVMSRLDMDTDEYFDSNDFADVVFFNTQETFNALGFATSDIAEMGLVEISKTITALDKENRIIVDEKNNEYNEGEKEIERSFEDEQIELYDDRRLQPTEPGVAGTARSEPGQIRSDAEEISEGTPQSSVLQFPDEGQTDGTLGGSRTKSVEDGGGTRESDGVESGNNRAVESEGHDVMGSQDEQPEERSAGDSKDGNNFLINDDFRLLPSVSQQLSFLEDNLDARAEVRETSAFVIPQEVIDDTLCDGSGFVNGKMRIYEQFKKSLSLKENAEFLKKEYGIGGATHTGGHAEYQTWHDAKGVRIDKGFGEDRPSVLLNWNKVARRIAELISMDRYLTEKQKEQYPLWLEEKEIMSAQIDEPKELSLAERLMQFYKDNDFYEYQDSLDSNYTDEDMIQEINNSLESPISVGSIIEFLSEFEKDENSASSKEEAKLLLNELSKIYEQPTGIDRAKWLIEEYFLEEFGEEEHPDYSVLSKIDVAYTTTEDELHEIQASVNLIDYSIDTYLDKELIRREEYSDIKEFIDKALFNLDFMDLVYVSEEEIKEKEAANLLAPPAWEQKKKSRVQSFDLHPDIPLEERINFDFSKEKVEEVGKKDRFHRNMEAIRVLKKCQLENRFATPEEQIVLSKYVGWGGIPEVFDEHNDGWSREFTELNSILSSEEYASARESTLTAFYTPPEVITAIYKVMNQMGFREGNLLEPSCGIGHFIGMLPDSMKNSKVYGVELDTISAGIAQQLYQKSSIMAQGFEEVNLPDSFFDGVIGNVPFGDFKVLDKRYDKNNFLIHDYFFAKSLDKLRPGGVLALVTSKGTMDKENSSVRKYIAQRADLLGAIRLPNNTFKGNAGTEVVSDVLILQKRDRLVDIEPDWVHLDTDENGIKMNSYFVQHPEMILGEMKMVSGRFGMEATCEPYENADIESQLDEAVTNIHGEIIAYETDEELSEEDDSISADPTVRNFSYTMLDDRLYFRENSRMTAVEVSATAENRIKGMIAIRDSVRKLIDLQTEDYPDTDIKEEQNNLNSLYDNFTKKYGIINSRANVSAFSQDSSFSLLSALEVVNEEGELERKADMFYKRTIKPHTPITSVDTSSEALAVSMGERAFVDMDFMRELTGKAEDEIFEDLKGVIFLNPLYEYGSDSGSKYLMADEYLSGNVREKLIIAKRSAEVYPNDYKINVEALKKVQPKDLTASEISVRLGATWLPTEVIEEFMFELLDTPRYAQWNMKVHFSPYTSEWNIENKSYDRVNVKAYSTYGTSRINAYKIFEETLNLKDVRIFDYVEDEFGKKKAILNKKETAIAQAKQELIKQAFQDWIWSDPARREKLTKMYNEKFNSLRPREYDGSHITFNGMNPEIELREHQRNAVAHILYGGNTLLAHAVGAGKTFEMVAAAQESKRLGLCNKSLFVVPNHLTEQWASEYMQLYPSANILVATKKDFETKNRKKFCGRIATGDYDAVIIGHSQFEKIPMSIERQRAILEQQLEEVTDGIAELKHNRGERFSVKQLEKTKKAIKLKLDKLNDQSRKDDVVTFEELGVDRLFIDESHYYKNLYLYTKMRNVGGIAQTEAQKSSDLFMKCRYLDEITGGRGTVFATGTPISNSMVELYTIQRYLQYNTLQRNGLQHFDAWASTFGETVTAVELTPEGTGYRAKTRFAKFYNLPELMAMFKEVADIKTADMLDLPVPKATYHNVAVKPSEMQQDMVEGLADRAEKVRGGGVDSSIDNMLKITNDGRKLALDQRMLNDMLPDFEGSKINACVDNVYQIWKDSADNKSSQLIFCDLSTPKNDGTFSVYNDIRSKLVERGIPADEIKFIHEADTDAKKKELFQRTRKGDVRVLIGSTQKMGAGTNVQDRLIALHDVDCPWRPSDLEQRSGRIIRQGNSNPEVEIYRYVTEQTFDAYLYQLVEGKQKFASQIMTSKSPVRSAEDIDETALSYAEIKMLATGNPYIKEKMDLDIQVQKLRLLKSNFLSEKYALEDKIIKYYPQRIATLKTRLDGLIKDVETVKQHPKPTDDKFFGMEVEGVFYSDKAKAGQAIIDMCKSMKSPEPIPLGTYRGFQMELLFDSFDRNYVVRIKGETSRNVPLGEDVFGNITRIDNGLERFEETLVNTSNELENTQNQLLTAQKEVEKPFAKEEELKAKTARLDELNILLNMDKRENEIVGGEPDEGEDMPIEKSKEYER